MDRLSKEQRRKTMQAVKSADSKIEIKLRKALWHKGYRYRKNCRRLKGKPDIVFPRMKIVVFCDSEFWHGFDWENTRHDVKSNKRFWIHKIERNIERDKEITETLQSEGWTVIRLWGKQIENELDSCVRIIENAIKA